MKEMQPVNVHENQLISQMAAVSIPDQVPENDYGYSEPFHFSDSVRLNATNRFGTVAIYDLSQLNNGKGPSLVVCPTVTGFVCLIYRQNDDRAPHVILGDSSLTVLKDGMQWLFSYLAELRGYYTRRITGQEPSSSLPNWVFFQEDEIVRDTEVCAWLRGNRDVMALLAKDFEDVHAQTADDQKLGDLSDHD